jgi:predicted O-methyltransferase YrrM
MTFPELFNRFSNPDLFGPRAITEEDARTLLQLADSIDSTNPQFLEIGCWLGHSTRFLAHSAARRGGTLHCVDHWKGSPGTIYGEGEPFLKFEQNLKRVGLYESLKIHKISSEDASLLFTDGSLDLVFVDGDHIYQSFVRDFTLWKPKVKIGGILCGHDCPFKLTSTAPEVQRFIEEYYLEAYVCSPLGIGVHPGVVKGLYDLTGDQYNQHSDIWWMEVK